MTQILDPRTVDGLLDVRVERETPHLVRLGVSGELDMCTSPVLLDRIAAAMEHGPAVVVLDLSGLDFADVSGTRAFQEAHRRLAAQGTRLVLAAPQSPIRRLLAMTRMDRAVEVREP
jgi:anti-sigma B factor antagonist